MPNHSGNSYLLDEISEPNTDFMASQSTLVDLMAKLEILTTGLDKTNEKVDKLVTDRESSTTAENLNSSRNNRRHNTDNTPNPDDQFLKNIKIDVSLLMAVMSHKFF